MRQLVSSLSGGQRQTVAIAKAVLWESKLVVLDEPTAALGVAQTRQVLDLVRRLADTGHAVVFISHNMVDVFEVADRVAALYLGRMAADIPISEVNRSQVIELITAGRSGDVGHRARRRRCRGGLSHVRQHDRSESTSAQEPGGAPSGFEGDRSADSLGASARAYVDRVRGGDLGALPAVLGIVVLGLLFTVLRPETFLTPRNMANLADQAAPIIILAMGLVFVLLLGEIDLSAGVVSGVCAAVMAKLLADVGSPWYVAVAAAILTGVLIGLFTGSLVGLVGIPSFVVTLALFLGWQGFTLRLIGEGGTVPVRDPVISALSDKNLPVVLGWVLAVVVIALYAALQLNRWRVQRAQGPGAPAARRGADPHRRDRPRRRPRHGGDQRRPRPGTAASCSPASRTRSRWSSSCSSSLTFLLGRTGFGRHVYAVGGNAEAARRAGISVTKIKVPSSSSGPPSPPSAASWRPPGWARSRRAPAAGTRCSTRSARRSSVAPASSVAGAGPATPSSVAWWWPSSPTGWACSAPRRT